MDGIPDTSPTGKFLGATGGLLGGIGSLMASNAQASSYATSERAARAMAEEAPKVAAWKITRARIIQRKTRSAQAMAAYASGVQVEGTPTDVMQLTEQELLLDERQIWREGQIEKMSLEEQAAQYAAARKAAKRSGFMGMVQTGISVASFAI
jgi:hypothetical protein